MIVFRKLFIFYLYYFQVNFAQIEIQYCKCIIQFCKSETKFCKCELQFAQTKFKFSKMKLNFASNAKFKFRDMKYISHLMYMLRKLTFIDKDIIIQVNRAHFFGNEEEHYSLSSLLIHPST